MPARALLAGASRYMGSVLVGVLLAPVAPDIAVDLFGAAAPTWRDPMLRLGSLVLVLGVCLAVYWTQLARAVRRARRAGYALTGIGDRDVLVLPVGFTAGYSPARQRAGAKTIQEWLVDTCKPDHVIVVGTPQVRDRVDAISAGLAADGIGVDEVTLTDATDPEIAVAEAQHLVIALMRARSLIGRTCYVDTTGGSVPMSIAMLRLGALLGVECTYVASDFKDNQIVPATQRGRAFDPVALFAATP